MYYFSRRYEKPDKSGAIFICQEIGIKSKLIKIFYSNKIIEIKVKDFYRLTRGIWES